MCTIHYTEERRKVMIKTGKAVSIVFAIVSVMLFGFWVFDPMFTKEMNEIRKNVAVDNGIDYSSMGGIYLVQRSDAYYGARRGDCILKIKGTNPSDVVPLGTKYTSLVETALERQEERRSVLMICCVMAVLGFVFMLGIAKLSHYADSNIANGKFKSKHKVDERGRLPYCINETLEFLFPKRKYDIDKGTAAILGAAKAKSKISKKLPNFVQWLISCYIDVLYEITVLQIVILALGMLLLILWPMMV